LFTEVQNLSSVAVSQCSIVPWGSGLTPVSLILLLQLMREVLSDPSKMKKTCMECMFPKEPSRCDEFVEILKVFPHQCDICCFCASHGVKPFIVLCLSLWEFGMSWL